MRRQDTMTAAFHFNPLLHSIIKQSSAAASILHCFISLGSSPSRPEARYAIETYSARKQHTDQGRIS
jgi:hypothetical protein